jgi:hypothetical protein
MLLRVAACVSVAVVGAAVMGGPSRAMAPDRSPGDVVYEYGGLGGVRDVELTAVGQGYSVGGSVIGRWDGVRWRRDAAAERLACLSVGLDTLAALDFSDPDFGLAVGRHGLVLSYESGDWACLNRFTGRDLRDVEVISRSESWAVGDGIWHYFHGGWSQVPVSDVPPWGLSLYGVVFENHELAWAVGTGVVLRYLDGKWSVVGSGPPPGLFGGDFRSVTLGPGSTVWAVGLGGVIRRYVDGKWTIVISPVEADLLSVAFSNQGVGWIGLETTGNMSPLLRYDGGTWHEVEVACFSRGVTCPFVSRSGDATAQTSAQGLVGDIDEPPTVASIGFFGPQGWAVGSNLLIDLGRDPVVAVGSSLAANALSLSSAAGGWAVGVSGLILDTGAGGWSRAVSPTTSDLFAVDALDADHAWAVGAGVVLRLEHGGWGIESYQDSVMFDVEMADPDCGWAVGRPYGEHRGLILERVGGKWRSVYEDARTESTLYAVSLASDRSGWAVGWGGAIVRLSGGMWSMQPSPTGEPLFLVSTPAEDVAWAAGDRILLEWDGATWQSVPVPDVVLQDQQGISGMALRERDDGWLVVRTPFSDAPRLLHYDGRAWSEADRLPTSFGKTRVFYDDRQPFLLWFVDENAAVYRRRTEPRSGVVIGSAYLPRVQ